MKESISKYLKESFRGKDKIKVLFVCLGNICRSPAAHGVMEAVVAQYGDEDAWEIDSAGTGGYHVGDLPDRRMRARGSARGYDFRHICRQVRRSDFDEFDVIVPMDAQNEADLRRMAATIDEARKIVPMKEWLDPKSGYDYVPDPYYEGVDGFELVLDLLEDGCENMYRELTALRRSR